MPTAIEAWNWPSDTTALSGRLGSATFHATKCKQRNKNEFRAELFPENKVPVVEELVATYKAVGRVGDGVNDPSALGRATIGFAMDAAGSDAAIETADIALMSDDLRRLQWLIHHSRRTLAIARQNISFSLAVKTLFVVLNFAGAASLWSAIAADTGASLLVVFTGLRLLTEASRPRSEGVETRAPACSME